MVKVKLEDLINEFELICDDGESFLNRSSGQLFHLSTSELSSIENRINKINSDFIQLRENLIFNQILIEEDNFIQLPTKEEINEESILVKFCLFFPNKQMGYELYELMKNVYGKSWDLRDLISKHDIGHQWYEYKRRAFKKIAEKWCEKNDVLFK